MKQHENTVRPYLPGQHFVQQDTVGPPVHGLPIRLVGDDLWEDKRQLQSVAHQKACVRAGISHLQFANEGCQCL